MYACLHTSSPEPRTEDLLALALGFSPVVEQSSPDTVVFSIAPLRKLIGSPHQIASEICRRGFERKLQANLALAANPDTAILLARNCIGVTLVTPGEERQKLAAIPLTALSRHDAPVENAALAVLHRWGVHTCDDLACLPEAGVAERLGQTGVYLRKLACGAVNRPLRIAAAATRYEERVELEHALRLLEPLLFLFARALNDLCSRLRSYGRAARALKGTFELENKKQYECRLEFPVPVEASHTILKLLQLHLERHPPEEAVVAFTLEIEPVDPRPVQNGIFIPLTPRPDKLQVTLARIAGMVGEENVGTPLLLNTHRPDAFQLTALNPAADDAPPDSGPPPQESDLLRLGLRLFRPALEARVVVHKLIPRDVVAQGVAGQVLRSAGPWKTSGEWWAATAWAREEWDVALDDGALYRIYRDVPTRKWYVNGIYD